MLISPASIVRNFQFLKGLHANDSPSAYCCVWMHDRRSFHVRVIIVFVSQPRPCTMKSEQGRREFRLPILFRESSSDIIRRGRRGAAPACPVGVEELAARPVDALVGVGPEEV